MYIKNTASQNLPFCLVNATTGAALTGATVTAKRCLDGAAQASMTGTVSETAGGQYNMALSQADTNADTGGYLFTATSAIPVHITIAFFAANIPANVVTIATQAVTCAAGVTVLASVGTAATSTAQTGDSFARVGAPAGASVSADVAAVKVDTAAVKAKTDNLPATPAATGDAMTLTAGERNSIATAHLDLANGVETGITVRQGHRVNLAASAGKVNGGGTATMHLRDQADTKNRVTATVDSSGNRTAITLDLT